MTTSALLIVHLCRQRVALTPERVIIIVCFLLLLRSLVADLQAQRSLRWWHSRQLMKLRHEAETIRNGLLQESFVLRRSLEVALANQGEASERNRLGTMEKFHLSLKELSDRLSPPYIDENFPHAIRHLLEAFQSRYPAISVHVSLPTEWQQDGYEHRRAILMVLNELFQMRLSNLSTVTSMIVSLRQQKQQGELIVQFIHSGLLTTSSDSNLINLRYLRRVFRFLTAGDCSYRCVGLKIIWHFRWQLPRIQQSKQTATE